MSITHPDLTDVISLIERDLPSVAMTLTRDPATGRCYANLCRPGRFIILVEGPAKNGFAPLVRDAYSAALGITTESLA